MIITSTRISTKGGVGNVLNHVLRGKGNEEIRLLAGTTDDMRHALLCAQSAGVKYCLRHFSLSPEVEMSRKEVGQALKMLAAEYGFGDRPLMVVEHQKPRQGGQGYERHWHCLVGEVSPSTLRVLSNRTTHRRNEKVARMIEHDLGHPLTQGAHNRAVATALRAEGRSDIADKMDNEGLTDGRRPKSAYDKEMHQEGKRRGKPAPATLEIIKTAWAEAESHRDLRARMEAAGLSVRMGDRRNVPIVTAEDGRMIGSLPRLLQQNNAEVTARWEALKGADMQAIPAAKQGGVEGGVMGRQAAPPAAAPFRRDCQEFRVRASIMGRKEISHAATETADDPR